MRKSRWTLAFFGFEAPSNQIAGVKGDAKEVGRDKAELRGADANDAYDSAIDGGDHPALPKLAAKQDRAEDGENARDVIQANVVEQVCHFRVSERQRRCK